MKRKGITIWEQHLERFVLGAALLFFLGFTAWQFMSQPNSVDQGKEGTVTPGAIDDLLKDRAVAIQTRLAPEAAAAIEIPDHRSVHDVFAAALGGSISPTETIVAWTPPVVLQTDELTGIEVAYVVPELPAPTQVRVGQTFDAIDEDFVAGSDALAKRFPEPPHDITWMTTAALFDLKSVREQYKHATGDVAPIPTSWHYDRYDILDVKLEREQYVDGVWTNHQVLDVIPEQVTVRDRIGGSVERATRDEVLRYVGQPGVQEAILRPDFYDTVNDSWTLPDPRVEAIEIDEGWTAERKEIGRLEAAIRRFIADRDGKLAKLRELGGSMDRDEGKEEEKDKDDERGSPPGGAGGGGGAAPPGGGLGATGGGGERRQGGAKRGAPGGGVGMTGAGAAGPTGGGAERDLSKVIERLKNRIRGLNRKIGAKERELAALRGDDGKVEEVVPDDANDMDEVLIYAHDINIESGAIYRYRFTVDLYNPFFARKTNLLDEQQHLADNITLSSAPSEWSEPQEVIPDRKIYITRAFGPGPDSRNAGQIGMGQATAEVFRFAHGRWWRENFLVEPGNRIGDEKQVRGGAGDGETAIDYGTDWFVLDVIPDIDALSNDRDRGYGATVLLQRLGDGATAIGDPVAAEADEDRQWLRDAVDLADLSGDLASR